MSNTPADFHNCARVLQNVAAWPLVPLVRLVYLVRFPLVHMSAMSARRTCPLVHLVRQGQLDMWPWLLGPLGWSTCPLGRLGPLAPLAHFVHLSANSLCLLGRAKWTIHCVCSGGARPLVHLSTRSTRSTWHLAPEQMAEAIVHLPKQVAKWTKRPKPLSTCSPSKWTRWPSVRQRLLPRIPRALQ